MYSVTKEFFSFKTTVSTLSSFLESISCGLHLSWLLLLYFQSDSNFFSSYQISLLEMPRHNRKKATSLTTNVMRDDSDKVKSIDYLCVHWNTYLIVSLWKPSLATSLGMYWRIESTGLCSCSLSSINVGLNFAIHNRPTEFLSKIRAHLSVLGISVQISLELCF